MPSKLKGYLDAKGIKYSVVARNVGISDTSFRNKLHGRTDFTLSEARNIATTLSMSQTDIYRIFFSG